MIGDFQYDVGQAEMLQEFPICAVHLLYPLTADSVPGVLAANGHRLR